MPPIIDKETCTLCGNCVEVCPGDLLGMEEEGPSVLYPDECWHCGNCRVHCPAEAVAFKFPLEMII